MKKKLRQRGIDPTTHKPISGNATESQEEKPDTSTIISSPVDQQVFPNFEQQYFTASMGFYGVNNNSSELCEYGGYGESSSNSTGGSNWNCSSVSGNEVLNWDSVTHIGNAILGEEHFEPKFAAHSWQEHAEIRGFEGDFDVEFF